MEENTNITNIEENDTETKEHLIVVLEDPDDDEYYFMEVYAGRSECVELAMRNCRNIYPDTVGHHLICVRVAK